jgi:hypothetical protein
LVVSTGGLPTLLVGVVTHGDAVFEFRELESLPQDELSFFLKIENF